MFSRTHVILAFLGGNFLCLMASSNITWSTSVIPKLTNPSTSPFGRTLTNDEVSWVSSLLTIGASLGVFFIKLSDKVGRKTALLIAGTPSIFCHIILAFANKIELYYMARFVLGLSLGGTYFLAPIYAGELIYKNHRGILASSMGVFACLGLLLSNAIGPFLSIQNFSLVLSSISIVSLLYFYKFGEEVPHYYITRNQELLARAALQKLRGGYEDIDDAFTDIRSRYLQDKECTLLEIFSSKPLFKALIMSSGLLVLQQLSGPTVILFYGQTFFQNISELSPETCLLILSSIQLLSSMLPPLLSCRFGIKPLLIWSATGMAVFQTMLVFYIRSKGSTSMSYFPLVCLIGFILSFNVGFGSFPFLFSGEIFPTKVKSLAAALVGFIYWMVGFLLTRYFIQIRKSIGLQGYFASNIAICVMAVFFCRFYLIETKDKSLEDIQRELSLD